MNRNTNSVNSSGNINSTEWSRRLFLRSSGLLFGLFVPFIYLNPLEGIINVVQKKTEFSEYGSFANLVKENRKFVVLIAKQYEHQGLSLKRLVELGNKGLITASGFYDKTADYSFISYAQYWVRVNMLQALAEKQKFGYLV